MRIVQLNIWSGRLVYRLPKFITDQQADIVCMQEVIDSLVDTSGQHETLTLLQKKCNFADRIMSANFSYQSYGHIEYYGNGMLSNLPVKASHTVYTRGEYLEDHKELSPYHPRNFQHVTLVANDKPLHIINFHGEFIANSKDGSPKTMSDIQTIIAYTKKLAGDPIIITGDFNLAPDSDSIQLLSQHFRNLSVEYGLTSTYSTVVHEYKVVCDYIFVNEHIKVNDFSMSNAVVSDHQPLIMDFDV